MQKYATGAKTVFRDMSVLDFNYVPADLPHREKQLQRLYSLFKQVTDAGIPQCAFLTGSVGSGKTATAKRFCLDLKGMSRERGVDFCLVNCRSLRGSEQGIILKILNHFDPRFPDRGFSLGEMLASIRKHIASRQVHLIVILDEAEVLLKKSGSNLIYDLTRFDADSVTGKGSLSLLLISQKYVYDLMDEASLSTFKRTNAVEFGRYNEEELLDIVKQRAALALHEGAGTKSALGLIAEIASELGDARYAIELLEKAGMLADEDSSEKISPEHVRGAKATTHSSVTESILADVPRDKVILLLAIARLMKDKPYLTTGEVEKGYAAVCEEYGAEAKAHTQLWQYLKDLDSLGIIDMRKSADGAAGRTSLISITEVPAKVLKAKIEELLKAAARSRKGRDG